MDQDRFDDLTQAVAEGSTRRSIFTGLAGGGLAALLAAVGLGTVGVEDAEAGRCERRCRRRFDSRKQQRRCIRRRCRGGGGGGTSTPRPVSGNPAGAAVGAVCAATSDCDLGLVCAPGGDGRRCRRCPDACAASGLCCLVGACVLEGAVEVCL